MTLYLIISLFLLLLISVFYLYRIVAGPDIFDRLIGLNGISMKAVLFIILLGSATGQLDMLIDISIGYVLLNLVGTLAVGKFLEKKGWEE